MASFYGDITISKAGCLRWAHTGDGLSTHFDNTLIEDEDFHGITTREFCHHFVDGDSLPIQLKLYGDTSGSEVILEKRSPGTNNTAVTATATTDYATAGFKIYEYLISLADGDDFYLYAYTDVDSWTSETIKVEASLADYLKIEWFNYDPLTNNENWQFDYSTTQAQANVNFMYLKANIFEHSLSGDTSILDNQDEKIVLRRSIFRRLKLESEPIPRAIAEKLAIAMGHDAFAVNDVTYTFEEDVEIERISRSNLVNFGAVLTQKSVLGLNTYDVGFETTTAEDDMMHLREDDVNGAATFSIPSGYLVVYLTAYRKTGTPLVTAGTSAGANDVLYGMNLNATDPIWQTAHIAQETAYDAADTLHVTTSGGTADIDILLIYNRQA